ncbi:ATP-binding cassette domain-containing protein [Streptomyces sp. DSM 41524]|uniref:ATP-binding cassette domain-containing protein n=1 Tax=Streptomyces asiaticus subsp. ignotus TaxID=3098222 RepID=A0ABU7PV87_9ACTN|nr:ATP-binding cassette domain-containing protein [Streptomyces sp. PRh5]EXU63299.1 sugar ABC transporter ATP-binding protein [Streptomyces sp. PRh5]MEE4593015.1 ATP-binding cassette domain-containing protein [Streptomyces sp. DSM 41524]
MNPRNNPRNDHRNTTTDVLALQARGLVKRYGHVTALGGADVELRAGEVLAVIGDNGAGKSTLIKCLSGAEVPDAGEIRLFGEPVRFRNPLDARDHGLETVYQNLAVAPSRDIPANLFLGRERRRSGPLGRVFRLLDKKGMREETRELLTSLGLLTIQNFSQPVETLSGGQRQGVAVARAACFGSRVIIMDEPTAALGVRESQRVLDLIREIRDRGVPVILISHDMPHVFDVADRIHVQRLGRRVALVNTSDISMPDAVALMTGALDPAELDGRSPAGTP